MVDGAQTRERIVIVRSDWPRSEPHTPRVKNEPPPGQDRPTPGVKDEPRGGSNLAPEEYAVKNTPPKDEENEIHVSGERRPRLSDRPDIDDAGIVESGPTAPADGLADGGTREPSGKERRPEFNLLADVSNALASIECNPDAGDCELDSAASLIARCLDDDGSLDLYRKHARELQAGRRRADDVNIALERTQLAWAEGRIRNKKPGSYYLATVNGLGQKRRENTRAARPPDLGYKATIAEVRACCHWFAGGLAKAGTITAASRAICEALGIKGREGFRPDGAPHPLKVATTLRSALTGLSVDGARWGPFSRAFDAAAEAATDGGVFDRRAFGLDLLCRLSTMWRRVEWAPDPGVPCRPAPVTAIIEDGDQFEDEDIPF